MEIYKYKNNINKKVFTLLPMSVGGKSCAKSIRQNSMVGGFTLVETLVAVTILVTAIAGPLVIAYQGVSIGIGSKDRLIASYLAQDAIEYVRYRVATNSNDGQTGSGVLNGLNDCIGGSSCCIDTYSDDTDPLVGCENLSWNSSGNYYGYGSGVNWDSTNFKREIKITDDSNGPGSSAGQLGGDTEFVIDVTVSWGKNQENSLTIVGGLIDWRIIFN